MGNAEVFQKLSESHHKEVMDYLLQHPSINLFIIGDLERFGYDVPFQDVFAYYSESGNIIAVVLRFYNAYILHATGEFPHKAVVEILDSNPNMELLQGDFTVLEPFVRAANFAHTKSRRLYFAERKPNSFRSLVDGTNVVRKAGVEDVDRILDLRMSMQEFRQSSSAREMLVQTIESGSGTTYYIEDETGRMIAAASTTAENRYSAMIVGVCTRENIRRRGYATLCLAKLVEDYDCRQKTLCLFYDNPDAGKIYKRLGFEDIGEWAYYPTK